MQPATSCLLPPVSQAHLTHTPCPPAPTLQPDVDGWGLSLKGLMGMVVIGE
jgi:hypothetical protein